MAGHSKWANIKHRKAAQDAKRGKLFTKLIREISVAARLQGSDQSANPRLRTAVTNALANNMPRHTIEKAISKGSGEDESLNVDEIRYEGYAFGGIAVMVDCMTDNKNRTVGSIRYTFNKYGGKLGINGSVSHLFNLQGIITFDETINEDQLIEVALEAGAYDVISKSNGQKKVITQPDDFSEVTENLNKAGLKIESAELTMNPETTIEIDHDSAYQLMELINALEDLEDVQKVYTNAKMPYDVLYSANGSE